MYTSLIPSAALLVHCATASNLSQLKDRIHEAVFSTGGVQPKHAVDADTTKSCKWWFHSAGGKKCLDIVADVKIALEELESWVSQVSESMAQNYQILTEENPFHFGSLQ